MNKGNFCQQTHSAGEVQWRIGMKVRRQLGQGRRLSLATSLLVLSCCVRALPVSAANDPAQLLQEWVVDGNETPAGVSFWNSGTLGIQAEFAVAPEVALPEGTGAAVVRVIQSPCAQPSDIQLNYLAKQPLGKGGTYRVSFWVRASRKTSFDAAVIRDDPPWRAVAAGATTRVDVDTDWRQCQLAFVPDEDVSREEGIRCPYLGLGTVPPDTTLWVGGAALFEIEAPPPPVPLLRSAELLENPGFEAGLSGWVPQAGELSLAADAGRTGAAACLVKNRSKRWGTPSQDVRAALAANGMAFYEFGASVREAKGKGEAFAVLHFRDAVGDHWVTSETRGLNDGGFTVLSAHRLVTWKGQLEAADIGVQTTGSNTTDILVDDFSLRALENLARSRPATSSGDAAGGPPARAVDGDFTTSWRAATTEDSWLEVALGRNVSFNACVLGEEGAHTRSYALEAWEGGQGHTVFVGGEIFGEVDELHFPPASGSKVRLRFTRAEGAPAITEFALYGTAIRDRTMRVALPSVDPRERGERTLVGAIRWDGWCGDKSRVGLELERVMAPERYQYRLPFYAQVRGPGQVETRCVSQETMDREIAFAKEAGIDYWAFDWYPPADGLSTARSLYLTSANRNDVKWCVILGTGAFSEEDRRWLIGQFRAPNYQTVLAGRPLVYVFNASRRFGPLVKSLRDEAAAAGCPTPFLVFMGWGPAIAQAAAECGADALGAYVNPLGDRAPFASNMAHERSQWEALRGTGRQMVPTVTTGWDPRPFLDCPVPWYPGATERNWVETAKPEEVSLHLSTCLSFVQSHPEATLANTVLVYAWNENAEGGWVIPTLVEQRDAGIPLRLDAVRSVLKPAIPRGSGWDQLTR